MLNPAELTHSGVTQCLDALVGSAGGLLLYDQGLAGREVLLAAGAQLALASGRPLTVVDASSLRNATAGFLDQLGAPHHTFLSPAQAAAWPTGFTPGAVLAIHADVLLDPAVQEPLLAAAREASSQGHLLVARRPDGAPLLDVLTAQTHQLLTNSVSTAQPQTAAGPPARYRPGPATEPSARIDDSAAQPATLRLPPHHSGPAAVAAARWPAPPEDIVWIDIDTAAERDPVTEAVSRALRPKMQMIRPNPFPELAVGEEAWIQSFIAATSPPNRTDDEPRQRFQRLISEETRRGLQQFAGTAQTFETQEEISRRSELPQATGTSREPYANTSRLPAHSPHGMDRRQDDALGLEELTTALEDPDLLRRVQQQVQSLARREAAAARQRRQADADRAAAQGHTPRPDTAQRQAHEQHQNGARQYPGR